MNPRDKAVIPTQLLGVLQCMVPVSLSVLRSYCFYAIASGGRCHLSGEVGHVRVQQLRHISGKRSTKREIRLGAHHTLVAATGREVVCVMSAELPSCL